MVCDGSEQQVPHELDAGFAVTFARLRRMFQARGLSIEDAADLAQEAIARTLIHLQRWPIGAQAPSVAPLVNHIAANLLIDHLRAGRGRVVSLDVEEADQVADVDVSEEVARAYVRLEVRRAIDTLPTRHRRAIALSLEGQTPAEIARHLGIRRNAADALLFRARRGLAERLRATGTSVRVALLLFALRARAGVRRVSTAGRELIPAGLASVPALNLMSAALAATLAVAPVAAGAGALPDRGATSPVAARSEAVRESGAFGGSVRDVAAPFAASIDPSEHRVSAHARATGPGGQENESGIDAWHERDEDDRGITGPLLDETTRQACDAARAACDPTGGPTP